VWIEQRLRIPKEVGDHPPWLESAERARAMIAALADAAGSHLRLPEAFFHYRNGHPANGPAPVRFGWLHNGLRIFGVGPRGVELIETHGHIVRRLLSDRLGCPCREERYAGECRILRAPTLRRYHIWRLAIGGSKGFRRHMDGYFMALSRAQSRRAPLVVTEAGTRMLRRMILEGLTRQIDGLLEGDPALEADGSSLELERLPFRLDRIGGCLLVDLKARNTRGPKRCVLKNVEFQMAADLRGIWHVGTLAARGYGWVTISKRAWYASLAG